MSVFLVKPFVQDTSLRSALGFMSLATRWGNFLFPGITVLTRDLYDVKAIHTVATAIRGTEVGDRVEQLKRRSVDERIGRELVKIVCRDGLPKPQRPIQQMTFGQRYGSLLVYFDVLRFKRTFSLDTYRQFIFDGGRSWDERPGWRARRIRHFKWYRSNRANLLVDLAPGAVAQQLQGRRWWLTGRGAPRKVPPAIVAVRELEFFFLIWQTAFEAAARLLHLEGVVSIRRHTNSATVEHFVEKLLECRAEPNARSVERLLASALSLHDAKVRPRAHAWERFALDVVRTADEPYRFVRLHNDQTIAEFAAAPARLLLQRLAELHTTYATLQNKPHAIAVRSFTPPEPGFRAPVFTAELNSGRWGLHGYRLNASIALYESRKYEV